MYCIYFILIDQDDDDNESSEESEFIQKLIDFHEAQDSQIPKVFWVGLKRVNLLSIYQKVKQMGGYETVTEQKMWKYLFGIDGGYNTISRKKYERAILPYERYEKYELGKEIANNGALMLKRSRSQYDDGCYNNFVGNDNGITRRLTEAEISEIQRQIKMKEANDDQDQNLHVEMSPGSLPVTVIVGNQKSMSPSRIQIKQPHTTITVHQTTIHPQTLAKSSPPTNPIQITNQIQIQQITVQPSTSQKQQDNLNNHKIGQKRKSSVEEFSGRDGSGFVANHLAKLGKSTSLRHVRLKPDRSKDLSSGTQMSQSSIGSITVSAVHKPNEKENIPYLSGSKTTTITPILGNSNKSMLRYPGSISEIIDLVDSDNESSCSSASPQSHSYSVGTMFPNMKKRKLDILRQGGLEVTAINNKMGPINNTNNQGNSNNNSANATSGASLIVPPVNVSKIKNNSKMNASLMGAHVNIPKPRFQSRCMYTRTARIFGNPKDLIPLPAQTTEYNCIDLTVEKCDPTLRIRLPESTTIQKAHFSALTAQKITDPNLQITLVPPLQHAHNSQNYNSNTKRKSYDSSSSSSSKSLSLAKISTNNIEKKLSLPPPLIHSPSSLIQPMNTSTSSDNENVLPSPTILNVPNLASMNDLKINQLFLQNMLDPMYLSNFYNNPNLFFQQTLPQELLQLYKNFPQGLGIIPISKS